MFKNGFLKNATRLQHAYYTVLQAARTNIEGTFKTHCASCWWKMEIEDFAAIIRLKILGFRSGKKYLFVSQRFLQLFINILVLKNKQHAGQLVKYKFYLLESLKKKSKGNITYVNKELQNELFMNSADKHNENVFLKKL